MTGIYYKGEVTLFQKWAMKDISAEHGMEVRTLPDDLAGAENGLYTIQVVPANQQGYFDFHNFFSHVQRRAATLEECSEQLASGHM